MLTFNTVNTSEPSNIVSNDSIEEEVNIPKSEYAYNVSEIKESEDEINTKPKTTKEIVKHYFNDIPIMVDVAYCESGIVQFNADGSVLRGFVNPQDVGVLQINEKYHLETSIKMGIDIYTLDGNLEYARFLYDTQGTRPWEYSSHCWNKYREVALN